MDYKNLTELEKNKLAKQYEPLVNKITNQFFKKGLCTWQALSSMAWEGFALSINKYDESRSNMNFTQYAAFYIRNNILTSLDNELRTVKLSYYAQQKTVESGGSLFNTISMDTLEGWNNEDEHSCKKYLKNISSPCLFCDGNIFDYLFSRIEDQFDKQDYELFYKKFGLKDYNETKGKDIAKEYNISEAQVSNRIKKIINWIRKDNDMCEMLANLIG